MRNSDARRLVATASGTRSSPASRARPRSRSPSPPYTTLATTPASREKPSSTSTRAGATACSSRTRSTTRRARPGRTGQTPGRSIPIDEFFIAKPGDSVSEINNALSRGKNLLFTPGVYNVDRTIRVKRPTRRARPRHGDARPRSNGVVADDGRGRPGVDDRRPDLRRRRGQLAGAAARSATSTPTAARAAAPTRPDRAARRVLPHRRRRTSARPPSAWRSTATTSILDDIWAWRADHGDRRRLDVEHRRHRRRRQRRRRDGHRPVRRALPEVQRRLERRERQDDLLPERAALRPAEPGGVAARRRARLGRLQGRPTR